MSTHAYAFPLRKEPVSPRRRPERKHAAKNSSMPGRAPEQHPGASSHKPRFPSKPPRPALLGCSPSGDLAARLAAANQSQVQVGWLPQRPSMILPTADSAQASRPIFGLDLGGDSCRRLGRQLNCLIGAATGASPPAARSPAASSPLPAAYFRRRLRDRLDLVLGSERLKRFARIAQNVTEPKILRPDVHASPAAYGGKRHGQIRRRVSFRQHCKIRNWGRRMLSHAELQIRGRNSHNRERLHLSSPRRIRRAPQGQRRRGTPTPGVQSGLEVMGTLMWVGRTLMFAAHRKLLRGLVAGGGFEPPTFGL